MASGFNHRHRTTQSHEEPVDLTYYNIFEVPPTATAAEIKKSYYALSLRYHPDRTQGMEESIRAEYAEHFKAISQAYAILSDPEKRALYNKYGKDECATGFDTSMNGLDPEESFRSFFGGEQFKDIIGDFESAKSLKRAFANLFESNNRPENSMSEEEKLLRREQEIEEQRRNRMERVNELARNLTIKLDNFVRACHQYDEGSIPDYVLERFLDEIRMETVSLIQAPYGEKLLHAIGYIYSSRAQLRLSKMDSKSGSVKDQLQNRAQCAQNSFRAQGHRLKEIFKTVHKAAQLTRSVSKLEEANKNDNDNLQRFETSSARNRKSKRNSSSKSSKPLTPEEKRRLEDDVASKSTKFIWQNVKLDLETTQNEVCDRVLNDRNVPEHILRLRCFALDKIGKIWQDATIMELFD